MRIRPLILFASLLWSMTALVPPEAAAGRIKINGSFELRESYDNNAFLQRRGKVADFFTTIAPLVNMSYRGNRLDFDAESGASFFIYGRNEDLNGQFFHERGVTEYRLTPKISLKAEDLFTYVNEIVGRPSDLSSNLVQSNSWWVGPVFRSDIGSRSHARMELLYGQTNFLTRAEDNEELPDFGETRGNVYVDRQVSERILVYTSQEFTARDYNADSQASFKGLLSQIGARLRLGRRFSIDLSGGYNWIRFDKLGKENGSVIETSITYTPDLRTRVSVGYDQIFTSDVFGNLFRQNRATLGLERQLSARSLLRLRSFYTLFDHGGTATPENTYFGGDLSLEHKIRRRTTIMTGFGYRQNAGSLKTDDYEGLRATIGVRYDF